VVLAIGLLVMGALATLPLFGFDIKKFVRSSLFVKIAFWVPIFAFFTAILYADSRLRSGILIALMTAASVEFWLAVKKAKHKPWPVIYFVLFTAGLAHFFLLADRYQVRFVNLLITIFFATALSDVLAFFAGSYAGRHKLPGWLNPRKSWEGVGGQLIGALLGVLLVNAFVAPVVTLWLFLPLGIGSAIGDLANSYAKRKAGVKDWSRAIPGHGGLIDRLSSTAGSAALLYYFLLVGSTWWPLSLCYTQ